MLSTIEAMKVVKAICDIERRKPKAEQSPAIAREARLAATALIDGHRAGSVDSAPLIETG